MSDRVFEDDRTWEVSGGGREVEVHIFVPTSDRDLGEVMIAAREGDGYDSQQANFTMTAKEATALKEFLIRKGY